ncbi:MAG TPA: lytic transglycosylase domain-containing protein [Chitinophagaceae bacterium]|nr:lytic transglycosylase domain-containing protein [Chitinophagaceae bacterium]
MKINKAGSVILILFFAVLRSNAGNNPSSLDSPTHEFIHDSIDISISNTKTSLIPEVPLHPSMENFVDDYAEINDELFEKIKSNKSNYFKIIDKIFVQHNIPVELKYLAVVESHLKTNAVSRVGAVGVWQFMPATARGFGLKITSRYDERQHLWKSSVAAARYLEELYAYFGDWLLVIAAYNSGSLPVIKAIKKSGSTNFWKIQYLLPKETRNHVKRFIATHYYFEGRGSLVTLGKAESEKYLKALDEFNATDDSSDDDHAADPIALSQWVAIINNEKDIKVILKK